MLRYPSTTIVCKNCCTNIAMYNDPYCGRCAELLGRPDRQETCKRCGAPNNIWIARSLANPTVWMKAIGGTDEEPGFGKARKSSVLSSGLCRWCHENKRLNDDEYGQED